MNDAVSKILSLLAKVKDPASTESERHGAQTMADKLMRKHGLSAANLEQPKEVDIFARERGDFGSVDETFWS